MQNENSIAVPGTGRWCARARPRGGAIFVISARAETGRSRRSWQGSVLALVLLTVCLPLAFAEDAQVVRADEVQAGTLLLATPDGSRAATRVNTDVSISVSGLIARTKVGQQFRNDGTRRVEGIYVFPLPDGAAVDRLRMRIGERLIEGEIRERDAARKTYEAAKSAGKRSGLVEQQRANLFTTSVAHIPAGETVVIEIEYLETVAFDDGLFSIRVPLTLTPRYIPGTPVADRRGSGWSPDTTLVPDASLVTPPVVTRSSDHRVTLHADIEAGVPLDLVASRYHPVRVTERDPESGGYSVELTAGDAPMDHDLELTWRPRPDAAPRASLFSETRNDGTYYLLMMLPPNDGDEQPSSMPRDLVLVIDTSGSMHGTSLAQAKRALLLALDGLAPDDRFNIVQFNSETSALFAGSMPATPGNVSVAGRYVDGLAANGGTEMRAALEHVLGAETPETHLRQVVFITDGSVGNESELIGLIDEGLGDARLFTVGIGSAPNGWFMRKAAEAGRGSYTFVSALHEVEEKMQRLVRKLERPQVTGIEVEWPGAPAAFPAVVPDLYAGEPVMIRARIDHQPRPGDQLRVSSDAQSGSWGVSMPLAGASERTGVAAMWARARIEDLVDRQRAGEDAEATRSSIIETALDHHLVSPYTSLVAVDRTPVPDPGSPLATERVPNLLPHGQSARAIFGLPATATRRSLHVATGTSLLLLAFLAWLGFGLPGRRSGGHASPPVG